MGRFFGLSKKVMISHQKTGYHHKPVNRDYWIRQDLRENRDVNRITSTDNDKEMAARNPHG